MQHFTIILLLLVCPSLASLLQPTKHILYLAPKFRIWSFLHISHGGGTYFISMAKLNGMNTTPGCFIHPGDNPRQEVIRRCDVRAHELLSTNLGLIAYERGLNDNEFCPGIYRYILFMRNPMDVVKSLLSDPSYMPHVPEKSIERIIDIINHPSSRENNDPGLYGFELIPDVHSIYYDRGFGSGLNRLDNFFIRSLAAKTSVYRAPLKSIGEQELQRAIKIIHQFEVVFTFDNMRDSPAAVNALLQKHLGWKYSINNASVPHNSHAPTNNLNIEQEQYFADLNKWDRYLYTFASEYFKKQSF
mmetsp:Transcript_52283/g.103843  ORF Transcript_52283/g.103843 Transcript_52283/m.103843 type:complete len:302 (+) Transcript_52283:90-995(+)